MGALNPASSVTSYDTRYGRPVVSLPVGADVTMSSTTSPVGSRMLLTYGFRGTNDDGAPPADGISSIAVAPASTYASPTYTYVITPRPPLLVTYRRSVGRDAVTVTVGGMVSGGRSRTTWVVVVEAMLLALLLLALRVMLQLWNTEHLSVLGHLQMHVYVTRQFC